MMPLTAGIRAELRVSPCRGEGSAAHRAHQRLVPCASPKPARVAGLAHATATIERTAAAVTDSRSHLDALRLSVTPRRYHASEALSVALGPAREAAERAGLFVHHERWCALLMEGAAAEEL